MNSIDHESRLRAFERNVELELVPLELGETLGLVLIFASFCVESCGGIMFYYGVWGHVHGKTPYTGLALVLAGAVAFGLTFWAVQPHKAAKHATHRLRHHVRKLHSARAAPGRAAMADSEVDAIADSLDRLA